MGILHPGITQSELVLRSEIGRRLTISEMDGNFVYLEDKILGLSQSLTGLSQSLTGLPVIPSGGTGGQVLAKASGTNYHVQWIDQTGAGTGGNGSSGTSGTSGAGVPIAGTAGYILAKASATDYDTVWIENTGGGGSGSSGTSGTSGTSGQNGTSGTSGTSGSSGTSANLESVRNTYLLGTYSFADLTATSYYLMAQNGTYSQNINNSSLAVELPWDINFLGATYSGGSFIYVNSNSYVTFGNSSGASNSIAPGLVSVPALFLGSGDNSAQSITWGLDLDDPEFITYRIRYEGSYDESGDGNLPTIEWEIILNYNTPDRIKVVFGTNLRNPGGVYGIGDGTNWVERFSPIPTYDEKKNVTYNAIDIYSYTTGHAEYSDTLSSIKFVGPGVYRSLSGTTATINIDPLAQFGIAVNYDTASPGTSVISSAKVDLRLTTGKDGGAVRIRPRGNVVLQPFNRNANQFGKGYDILLTASNASQDSTPAGDYDGGSIYITPGTGVGTGATGDVNIGMAGSYVNLLGNTVADAVDSVLYYVNATPGWSGTYSTGDGRVATVNSGIITNVS